MRLYAAPVWFVLLLVASPQRAAGWINPEATVQMADEILRESMTIPVRRIPRGLLAQAHGVAIIPDVIKIGFVAAVRRGHGVVVVRNEAGAWTLPQFVTLTGGSVGWQAGIQGTDVVLVFMTRKSVQGLLSGKFTIGADASVAAGPVGRNAAAATDGRLRAEILSYSRSRGLFVGVSLDGSVIEMDPTARSMYYGAPAGQQPLRVPPSALRLVQDLTLATETRVAIPGKPPLAPAAGPTVAAPAGALVPVTTLRQQLAASATRLDGIVDAGWKKYLALPKGVFADGTPPPLPELQKALARYDRVVENPTYEPLSSRQEFQSTYGLLREYIENRSRSTGTQLPLPPPPTGS